MNTWKCRKAAGLILSRRAASQPLTVEALAPGNQFHFEPGVEHCLIGTENLLVFEKSTDPKGMDQDLVFIYEPDTGNVSRDRFLGFGGSEKLPPLGRSSCLVDSGKLRRPSRNA